MNAFLPIAGSTTGVGQGSDYFISYCRMILNFNFGHLAYRQVSSTILKKRPYLRFPSQFR